MFGASKFFSAHILTGDQENYRSNVSSSDNKDKRFLMVVVDVARSGME